MYPFGFEEMTLKAWDKDFRTGWLYDAIIDSFFGGSKKIRECFLRPAQRCGQLLMAARQENCGPMKAYKERTLFLFHGIPLEIIGFYLR